MRLKRAIAINPLEPQVMSLRAPASMRLGIEIHYTDTAGVKLSQDVGGQLQLTARSSGETTVWSVPATDVLNGVALATIPPDTLVDPSGYRMRLIGTYKQEPLLFALGTLRLLDAAGIDIAPVDIIDTVPISMSYNYDTSITVRLWADAGKTAPFDLTTATITASVYLTSTATNPLAAFTVTPTALAGEVILGLDAATVNTLPSGCWWSLVASNAAGSTTLCQGGCTITGVVP